MSLIIGASWRQVVPRWRPWRTTAALGEVAVPGVQTRQPESTGYLERLLREYQASPNVGIAGDLLGASAVWGEKSTAVLDVARKVSDHSDRETLRDLAGSILEGEDRRRASVFRVEKTDSRKKINRLRKILAREPRNTVKWVDLAREHLILGDIEKSRQAMRVALALGPENRFVLRSASALYVQSEDFDLALATLKQSRASRSDPWLLAPQIAISDLSGTKQTVVRLAKEALAGDFPASHVAELAAALGTAELRAGSTRRGRQLFRQSVREPNENALAQVVWGNQRTNLAILDDLPSSVPRAFEAHCRQAAFAAEWADGIAHARSWSYDQPFSSEARIHASYCACEAEEWWTAKGFTKAGLALDPQNLLLLNNQAFAQIELGDLTGAADSLVRARAAPGDRRRIEHYATEALLLFRVGLPELGRQRYRSVIESFTRRAAHDHAAKAALMLAREELRNGGKEFETAWKRANELAEASRDAGVRDLQTRIERRIDRLVPISGAVRQAPYVVRIAEPLMNEPRELTDERTTVRNWPTSGGFRPTSARDQPRVCKSPGASRAAP